jgi:hypothetical protein
MPSQSTAALDVNKEPSYVYRTAFSWCRHGSGISQLLVSVIFWCQHFSGVRMALVSAFLWYQHFPDVRMALMSAFLWFNIFLMSGFPWCEETTREAWAGKVT